MDLNELAFQKLKLLKPRNKEIISFKKIWTKICTNFSINKKLNQNIAVWFFFFLNPAIIPGIR